MIVGRMPGQHAAADGSLTLTQVGQENYNVFVRGFPDGYYVKSVRAGDQEVRDTGLDMTGGAAGSLVVTIAPGAGADRRVRPERTTTTRRRGNRRPDSQ